MLEAWEKVVAMVMYIKGLDSYSALWNKDEKVFLLLQYCKAPPGSCTSLPSVVMVDSLFSTGSKNENAGGLLEQHQMPAKNRLCLAILK